MATKLPGIPAITSVQDTVVASILRPMKESIEILGSAVNGSPMASGQTASGGVGTTTSVTVSTGSTSDQDYTPPPAPTSVQASGAFSTILVTWNAATYSNHAYAEIWRSSTNVRGNATLIGFAPGSVYADPVSVSTTFYYWVRFVSTANVAGPYNAVAGTQGETSPDPAFVLGSLNQQIAATHLTSTLSGRIDLIDTPVTGLVAKVEDLQTAYGTTVSAATSAASAAQAASDAIAAKADAITAKSGSETARDSAVTAKTSAETAASNASTSATNASTSATNASGSASNAATSATAAANSATSAGDSATAAATSATSAATYATNAETASTASSNAKVAAESARDSAQTSATAAASSASTANTKASDAAQSASAASTSETNAATSASNASTSATNAASSETNASGSASNAATSATAAANSATAAGNSATAAATSASTASTKASDAETSATSASTSATNASTSAANALTYKNDASSSASTATTKAADASTSAGAAATSASNAGDSAAAAASSASTASTKANEASQSAAAANTSKVNAATSAANASTSASNAATSESNAAGSASSAADSLSSVQAIANGYNTTVNAAIQQRMIARAASDGTALAEYSVVTDVNGRIAGFGLGTEVTASGGAASSTFGIRADKFYIAPPTDYSQEAQPSSGTTGQLWFKPSTKVTYRYNGSAWVVFNTIAPFIVQTTPTTVNGVAVAPGVYMDAAYIVDGSITNAKIGNLAVDDAKITSLNAYKITTGYLSADRIEAGTLDAKIANISAAVITSGTIASARIGDATITSAKIADDIQSTYFSDNEFATGAPNNLYGIYSTNSWTTWLGDTVPSGTPGAPGAYAGKKFTLASGYVNGVVVGYTAFNVVAGQRLEIGLSFQHSSSSGATVELVALPASITYGSTTSNPSNPQGWTAASALASFTGTTPVSTNEAQFVDLRAFFTVPATYVDANGDTQTTQTVLVGVRYTAPPSTTIYVGKPFYMKDIPSSQTAFSPYRVGRVGWRINKTGSALFNDAIIKSNIAIGSAPYMSAGKLRGTGAVINRDGTFAFGSTANNLFFDGTALTLNVPFIQNPKTISVTASVAAASNAMSVGAITVASGAEITIPSDSTWTIT